MSTPAAVSAWQSANEWWSSTAAAFGLSNPRLAADRPSASQFHRAPDSNLSNIEGLADREQRTVLLVEDNPTDVSIIQEVIGQEVIGQCGLNVRLDVVKNGEEALLYFQDPPGVEQSACPALVLLDLNLPRVAGIEVLRQLRSGSRCNRTPVIVITSSTAEADRAAARRLGADAYFQKPNDLAAYIELAQLIVRLLVPGDRVESP